MHRRHTSQPTFTLFNFKYYFRSVIYSILYVIQIIWYKYIFIHQLQQYKNKIVVQLSYYYAHIYGCLGCGEAADHTITENSGLLYPFFFATYMVLFDTFLYYVCLSVLVRRTTGPNMSKLNRAIGPKSERFMFLKVWSTVKIRGTRVPQKAIVPVGRPWPYSVIILNMRFIPKASLRASSQITASSYILERHL